MRKRSFAQMILSCEHASHEIPAPYEGVFVGKEDVLRSHRGWDPGASDVAAYLAKQLNLPFYAFQISRLLIEGNRSLWNEELFSEFSRDLPEKEKEKLIKEYYHPYRAEVEDKIRTLEGSTLHLSIHTFTPVWEGRFRAVDIGILFDPSRLAENEFSQGMKQSLMRCLSTYNIRFNEPYLGVEDGFTTYLRTQYPAERYVGIELEINQRFLDTPEWDGIKKGIEKSIDQMRLLS